MTPMRPSLIIALSILSGLLFNTCKNDLKLNAPYKEIPSIYAVLNPQEKIQIIRINKVFLGEGDANQMAKVADSVNYQPGDLTVTLNRYVNGVQVDACPTCTDAATISDKRTITFKDDSLIQADPGAFSTTQRVYYTHADLHQAKPVLQTIVCGGTNTANINVNPEWKVYGDYVLTVKNNKTGNVFTAKATAVDSINGNVSLSPFGCPYSPFAAGTFTNYYVDYSELNKAYTVKYPVGAASGNIYQVVMRLHFYDYFLNTGPHDNYVDYVLSNQNRKDAAPLSGQYFLTASFKGGDILAGAGIALSKAGLNMDINRRMYKVQYLVYSSTDDYYDYLQFNAPSLSLSQNKVLYSNFENRAALGLFTFRARCSVEKDISTSLMNEFAVNENTCKYRFLRDGESLPAGCR